MNNKADGKVTIDVLASEKESEKIERLRQLLIEAKTLADDLASTLKDLT